MLFDEILIELLHIDIAFKKDIMLDSLICFIMKKIGIFSFNIDSLICLCSRAHYLKYVKGKRQGYRIAKFSIEKEKNNDFYYYFKVRLNYWK